MIYYSDVIEVVIIILVSVASFWLGGAIHKRDIARKAGYPDGKKTEYADISPSFFLIAVIIFSVYLGIADKPRELFYSFLSQFPSLKHRIPYYYQNL